MKTLLVLTILFVCSCSPSTNINPELKLKDSKRGTKVHKLDFILGYQYALRDIYNHVVTNDTKVDFNYLFYLTEIEGKQHLE